MLFSVYRNKIQTINNLYIPSIVIETVPRFDQCDVNTKWEKNRLLDLVH